MGEEVRPRAKRSREIPVLVVNRGTSSLTVQIHGLNCLLVKNL
jgi:hypothetical protein